MHGLSRISSAIQTFHVALGHHSALCLAVRKPIEVQKTPHPSQEEMDRLHQCYIRELSNLFEAHKLKYSVPKDQHLKFY